MPAAVSTFANGILTVQLSPHERLGEHVQIFANNSGKVIIETHRGESFGPELRADEVIGIVVQGSSRGDIIRMSQVRSRNFPSVQSVRIYGRDGRDEILGSAFPDTILGGRGADDIDGFIGDDLLFGNRGNDTVWGGWGRDSIYGQRGNDELHGGAYHQWDNAFDKIFGGGGTDSYFAAGGPDDRLRGIENSL